MKKSILIKSLFITIGIPLLAGCVTRVVYTQPPPPSGPPPTAEVVQPNPPPPAQVEVIPPQPDMTFVWVPGAWEWRGRWVWFSGHWGPRPHPGAVWIGSHWGYRHHRNVWISGHWQ